MSQERTGASRKTLLKLLSLGGVTAVSAHLLREYAPWTDYNAVAARSRKALPLDLPNQARMEGLVRYATLAANGHNAQPWKFALFPTAIEIHPDYSRRLAAVDPHDRELWISLGCALENLLHASRAMGYSPAVTYPDTLDFIRILLVPAKPQGGPLFDAIPRRQNTRTEYGQQSIPANQLRQIQDVALEPGIDLHISTDRARLSTLADYVHQAAVRQYASQPFLQELIHWLRFDKKEALASFDGLYSKCSANPAVPRWLGQFFLNGAKPEVQADADVKNLRSSAGAFVLTSESERKADWVRAGQVYQRLALTMTSFDIKSAFLNQPVEVETVRSELQSGLGLGATHPQLLVRFGYANSTPNSLRRPVAQVLLPS